MPIAAPPGTVFETAVGAWASAVARPNDSPGVTACHTNGYVARFQAAAARTVATSSEVIERTCAHSSSKSTPRRVNHRMTTTSAADVVHRSVLRTGDRRASVVAG